ncbi:hypothetical protein [Sorangium sp. So ce1335]|uniref:hypothetical protein n=1 Tax=Sorangium sp. So ce1335 TaxID=3133335 RepID=UPI003F6402E5
MFDDECLGQMTPGQETCVDTRDEDCDGTDCVLWASRFGDVSNQTAPALAVDQDDNAIIAGYFQGTLAFDPERPISANGPDIYLSKFDPTGKPLWSKRFGDSGFPDVRGTGVDDSGRIILTGEFDSTIDFDGSVVTPGGYRSIFLTQFTPHGDVTWATSIDRGDSTEAPKLAVSTSGDIAILGKQICTPCDSGFTNQLWLAKYRHDGSVAWTKRFLETDVGTQEVVEHRSTGGVAFDPFGNIVITGSFVGTEKFSVVTLTSAGGSDVFVAKFDSEGSVVWSARYGGELSEHGAGIGADSLGNVIIVGNYAGEINFGSPADALTSAGGDDIFVAKFSSAGTHLWSRSFGATGDQHGSAVAVDEANNIVFTGSTTGVVSFGGQNLPAGGGLDFPLVKLDKDGNHIWSKSFGDAEDQLGLAIATSSRSEVLCTATVRGTVNVGAGDLPASGGADIFLGKFAP